MRFLFGVIFFLSQKKAKRIGNVCFKIITEDHLETLRKYSLEYP